jgi:hypothetical protein
MTIIRNQQRQIHEYNNQERHTTDVTELIESEVKLERVQPTCGSERGGAISDVAGAPFTTGSVIMSRGL